VLNRSNFSAYMTDSRLISGRNNYRKRMLQDNPVHARAIKKQLKMTVMRRSLN
jgi:hypothetical protein